MRTTLTLDDDVAIQLAEFSRHSKTSTKEAVNRLIRAGLAKLESPRKPVPFRTRAVDLGQPKLANVDSISEALAFAEGEDYS
ncbi:MAG: hypothetical protein ACREN8_01730 [Candidatus Dormibacteraceae bacterium]